MEIIEHKAWDAWKASLDKVWNEGREFTDQEGRSCREALNLMIRVEDPSAIAEPADWLASQEEWVYPSLDQIGKVILDESRSLFYHYEYGERIFRFQGKKNQMAEFVIPLLTKSVESRRALLSLYDPNEDSLLSNQDVPCLALVYFRVVGQKLHVSGYIRSNDLFIGWPANIYQLFILQRWLAAKLGLSLGSLTTISGSAHVFSEYEEELKQLFNGGA